MAYLERIRKRSSLLLIIIGLAMFAFILTDLFSSGDSLLRGNADRVGKIDGEKIDLREFSRRMEDARENYLINTGDAAMNNVTEKQFADQVWNIILREKLYGQIQTKNGLMVSAEELFQRIIKNPGIRDNASFKNPNTGQFDPDRLREALANLRENLGTDPQVDEMWNQWLRFEEGSKSQAEIDKLHAAVQKGIFYPKALGKVDYLLQNDSYRTRFVALRYDGISDSTLDASAAEMMDYMRKNKSIYNRDEETRALTYVSFPIAPSKDDIDEIVNELKAIKSIRLETNQNGTTDTLEGFETTKEDSAFVARYSEIPYDKAFYKRDNLSPLLDSNLWNASVGFVFGPYEEDGFWQLTKLTARKELPDSVKAKHILIAFQGAERAGKNVTRAPQEAKKLADSLLTLVKNDSKQFESLSSMYSDDFVAKSKGGDLGWFNDKSMAKPFSDYCFQNKTGDVGLVITNFGFHIIEITGQSKGQTSIQVARIGRKALTSEKTFDELYNKATLFASKVSEGNLAEMAEKEGLSPRPVTGLKIFDENISGVGNNRQMVKWAFEEQRKSGDIQLFTNGMSNFVVAQLDAISPAGLPKVEELEVALKPLVIREKKRKMLIAKLDEAAKGGKSLEDIGAAIGSQVFDQRLGYFQANVSGFGAEPEFVATLSGMTIGKMTKPFAGENAVFLAVVEEKVQLGEGVYDEFVDRNIKPMRTRVPSALFDALEKSAKVTDERYRFY